jgi:hypothetical protein
LEGSQGNPSRVPPLPSSLEGAWIEIFRAGDYGERGHWSEEDLDRLAAGYNPRLQPAPIVLGHPDDDAPAYGWLRRLRRAGQSLWAQLEKVDPAFEALLHARRFRQRSVSLYKHFPPTGGPYIRHLGFLGAAPPAVKGLAPVRFADAATVSFSFDNQSATEIAMPEQKSTLDKFVDHLRTFFSSEPDDTSAPVVPSESEGSAFAERLTQLEQRLDTLAIEKKTADEKLNEAQSAHRQEHIASFVESLRRRGRFPPAFERWGVREFMDRLVALEAGQPTDAVTFRFGGDEQDAEITPLAWFQDFLSRLPTVIEFRELGSPESQVTGHQPPRSVVRFTEPQRGMTVDPASIELAERAEALAAERGITYAAALAELREQRRTSPATA